MKQFVKEFFNKFGLSFENTPELQEYISKFSKEQRFEIASYIQAYEVVMDYRGLDACRKYITSSFVAPEVVNSLQKAIALYEKILENCEGVLDGSLCSSK